MTPREYMAKPTGSRIEEYSASQSHLRFLHWLGYHPERIDGPHQTLIKLLSPGSVFVAPQEEHARYLAMLNA